MTKPEAPPPHGEKPDRNGEVKKERLDKDDGRYIIFYSFGDEETQESEDG
jgi:hypothetical protein